MIALLLAKVLALSLTIGHVRAPGSFGARENVIKLLQITGYLISSLTRCPVASVNALLQLEQLSNLVLADEASRRT